MRDNTKNEEYFKSVILKEEGNILLFENAVKKAILEKGELDRGTRNGYNILIDLYDNEINSLYSIGENLEKIKTVYRKMLTYYSKMWNRQYGYFGLIKVLSLAVLFEMDKKDIYELEEKILLEEFDDYLVNVFLNRVDSSWKKLGDKYEFNIYECLRPILEEKNNSACGEIKGYLQEKWYVIHSECAWYDSHKSTKKVYYGYWSFEAGAISKVLGIDDEELKDVPYYPYDLVHYNDYIGILSDGTQFVLPKRYCDEIAIKANGNISVYEKTRI